MKTGGWKWQNVSNYQSELHIQVIPCLLFSLYFCVFDHENKTPQYAFLRICVKYNIIWFDWEKIVYNMSVTL